MSQGRIRRGRGGQVNCQNSSKLSLHNPTDDVSSWYSLCLLRTSLFVHHHDFCKLLLGMSRLPYDDTLLRVEVALQPMVVKKMA